MYLANTVRFISLGMIFHFFKVLRVSFIRSHNFTGSALVLQVKASRIS